MRKDLRVVHSARRRHRSRSASVRREPAGDSSSTASGRSGRRGIGYRGRVGVFELLTMNANWRRLLFARATEEEILAAARASRPLRRFVKKLLPNLVRAGTTTLQEIGNARPTRSRHQRRMPTRRS